MNNPDNRAGMGMPDADRTRRLLAEYSRPRPSSAANPDERRHRPDDAPQRSSLRAVPLDDTTPPPAATFAAVSNAVLEGLSLRSAASLNAVADLELARWVHFADAGTEPFCEWLLALCRMAAEHRLATLRSLAKLAAVDASARRDWLKLRGAPSALERELESLRRVVA